MEKYNLSLKSLLINFSIFSIYLIPFAKNVSFETFPLLIFVLSILIIFNRNIFTQKYDKIQIISGLLILYICLSFIYNIPNDNISFLELIKYLIGPTILLSSIHILKNINIKFLYYLGLFLAILYILLKFKIPLLFDLSCNFLEFFIARYDCSNSDNLKNPFLITPEPSYLSLFLGFLILTMNLFKGKKSYKLNLKKLLILEFFLIFIIFETHSRIGFAIILILFLNYLFLYKNFKYILAILTIIFSTFFFKVDDSRTIGRIIQIKDSLENYNLSKNINLKVFIKEINVHEPTGAIRLLHNVLSTYGFYTSDVIFGHGPGSYSKKWYNNYSNELDLESVLKNNEVIGEWDLQNKKQYTQNYFFSILHDCGLLVSMIFLYLIVIAFMSIKRSDNLINLCIFLYVSLCFFYQSQITNPMPWLALGILVYNKDKKLFWLIRKDLLDKKYGMISTFKKYKILISNKLLFFYIIIFFVLSMIYSLNFLKNLYNHNIVISVDSNINFGVLNGENQINLEGEELIIHNLALFKRIKEFKSLLHSETTEKLRSKIKINLEEFDAKKMKLSNINEIYFFEVISSEKNNQKIQINIVKKLEQAFSESFVNNILYDLENDELENYLSQKYTVIKSTSSSTNNKLKSIIKLNILFISLMLLIYLINIQAFKFK